MWVRHRSCTSAMGCRVSRFVAAAAVLGLMAREVRQCGVCKSLPDVSTEQITRFNCTSFPDLGQKEGDYMEDGRRALLQTA